jgi:integrase
MWSYYVELPNGPNGQRRQWTKSGFVTAKEAADARNHTIAADNAGMLPNNGKQTVEDWLTGWLDGKTGSESIRSTTAFAYRMHVEKYLIPHLGHLRLIDLRPRHVTDMLIAIRKEHEERRSKALKANAIFDAEAEELNRAAPRRRKNQARIKAKHIPVPRPFGPATAHRVRATLRSALNAAVRAGEVPRNVAALADVAKASRTKVKVCEPEQLGEFLDAIAEENDRLHPLFHLAAFAGLRRGELCGLRWQDVDLDKRIIDVTWQRTTAGHRVIESTPKTECAESRVDIDQRTAELLKRHRKNQIEERLAWGPAWHDTGLVFTRENGAGLHPDFVSYRFEKLVDRHGLPRITLHKLRHLAASLQIAAGVDIAIVSKRLRHSSIKITNDTYGHMIGTIGRQAAEAAAALVPLRNASSNRPA